MGVWAVISGSTLGSRQQMDTGPSTFDATLSAEGMQKVRKSRYKRDTGSSIGTEFAQFQSGHHVHSQVSCTQLPRSNQGSTAAINWKPNPHYSNHRTRRSRQIYMRILLVSYDHVGWVLYCPRLRPTKKGGRAAPQMECGTS